MGFMHDTLQYLAREPVYRRHHHDDITFGLVYAFSENFVLPLSHDEVVHGKGSLLNKMAGDDWQKFANLRLLYGYMFTQPGKKLLFMGGEFGQGREWSHESSLDWHLLQYPHHEGVRRWVADLNRMYREEPAAHAMDFSHDGFRWIDMHDSANSVLSYMRRGPDPADTLLVVCNFTPVTRSNYRLGVPAGGFWKEILNSDAAEYGGSGAGNYGGVEATPLPSHGQLRSITLTLPPLATLVLKRQTEGA
jgi:1,4-alpha-glucan branching enzyme